NPGNKEYEYRKQFEECSPYRPSSPLFQVFGSKGTLYDILVRTPIPYTDYGTGNEQAWPRKVRIGRWPPHIKVLRAEGCFQFSPASHIIKTDESQRCGTYNQYNSLKGLRVNYGTHTSENGI